MNNTDTNIPDWRRNPLIEGRANFHEFRTAVAELPETVVKIRRESLRMCARIIGFSLEERKKVHHIRLLCDDGMLAEINVNVFRLTSRGHELAEEFRNENTRT